MNNIWKYELALVNEQKISLPKTSKILSVQVQNNKLCLWAIVDSSEFKTDRTIAIIATGNDCWCSSWNYIGTVQESHCVWHIFSEY